MGGALAEGPWGGGGSGASRHHSAPPRLYFSSRQRRWMARSRRRRVPLPAPATPPQPPPPPPPPSIGWRWHRAVPRGAPTRRATPPSMSNARASRGDWGHRGKGERAGSSPRTPPRCAARPPLPPPGRYMAGRGRALGACLQRPRRMLSRTGDGHQHGRRRRGCPCRASCGGTRMRDVVRGEAAAASMAAGRGRTRPTRAAAPPVGRRHERPFLFVAYFLSRQDPRAPLLMP